MNKLIGIFFVFFIVLQYQLWLGENSVHELGLIEDDVIAQERLNEELASRNQVLEVEVLDLKNGLEAVEERARSELGMIEKDETFYMIVPGR